MRANTTRVAFLLGQLEPPGAAYGAASLPLIVCAFVSVQFVRCV